MKKIKCTLEAQYDGHSIKRNGDLDLNFKLPYSELTSSLLLVQMINTNIDLIARIGTEKPVKLGTFMLKNLGIDRDGESKVRFNSEVDNIEINNFVNLTEKETIIKLKCQAMVEREEDSDEAEEEE